MAKPVILYIEDNFDNRLLVRRVLVAEGYEVVDAERADQALECLRTCQPDLILMDINMPEVDGYTLTSRIRSIPGYKSIPIVALTANVMRGDRERTLDAGCDGYIQKPVDIDILPEQINRYLRKPVITPVAQDTIRNPLVENRVPEKKEIPKDCTVLVVEDNVSNFVLIARMLGYLGIHCEWKTSGYEVVEFADTLPKVDLVLMDIRLPYEDGYGAMRKIKSAEKFAKIPIVAVTAEASQEQINKARASGFDGFLGKPLDPDRFPEQIRRIISGEPVWDMN